MLATMSRETRYEVSGNKFGAQEGQYMNQDFDHRISIVVNKELPSWQVLNTVAHVSAYFGNKLGDKFGTGEFFTTRDGVDYPRNSQYAIIVLAAKPDQLPALAEAVRAANDVQSMYFIREMIETTDDQEIIDALQNKDASGVELLGVGVFGENARLKELTKQFRLWS